MEEPPVAKLAPHLKFVPMESKYALTYGSPSFSAAETREPIPGRCASITRSPWQRRPPDYHPSLLFRADPALVLPSHYILIILFRTSPWALLKPGVAAVSASLDSPFAASPRPGSPSPICG
ncbi:hypothetical protein NL676_025813 [Syzygium grande]|nr:hypothetical protein NL676_025813 [Syzygium grande]